MYVQYTQTTPEGLHQIVSCIENQVKINKKYLVKKKYKNDRF